MNKIMVILLTLITSTSYSQNINLLDVGIVKQLVSKSDTFQYFVIKYRGKNKLVDDSVDSYSVITSQNDVKEYPDAMVEFFTDFHLEFLEKFKNNPPSVKEYSFIDPCIVDETGKEYPNPSEYGILVVVNGEIYSFYVKLCSTSMNNMIKNPNIIPYRDILLYF